MSQQHGFGYNGTEPTGSTKPDDDHDGMQQKGENVAHAQDGIRPKKLKIQEFATHRSVIQILEGWRTRELHCIQAVLLTLERIMPFTSLYCDPTQYRELVNCSPSAKASVA